MDFLLPGFTIFYTDRHGLKMIKKGIYHREHKEEKKGKGDKGIIGDGLFRASAGKKGTLYFSTFTVAIFKCICSDSIRRRALKRVRVAGFDGGANPTIKTGKCQIESGLLHISGPKNVGFILPVRLP
jgi:hypothetical protein